MVSQSYTGGRLMKTLELEFLMPLTSSVFQASGTICDWSTYNSCEARVDHCGNGNCSFPATGLRRSEKSFLRNLAMACPILSDGVPQSTYRLQFHAGFRLPDATALVDYLAALGISHAYASPLFRAGAKFARLRRGRLRRDRSGHRRGGRLPRIRRRPPPSRAGADDGRGAQPHGRRRLA